MRQTSINTYNNIRSNGLLSQRRWEVYDCIYNFGPMTASEVFKRMGMKTNQSGRFTELNDVGCIAPVGIKLDSDTGQEVTLWDCTANLPVKSERETPKLIHSLAALLSMKKLAKHLDEEEIVELRKAYLIIQNLNK